MKKIITMCLVYMMLFAYALPSVSVFAETPDLLFELDIAEGEGGVLSLSDASGSNLVTSVEAVGTPILKTLDTGKKYLELATYDDGTGKWTNGNGSEVLATFDAENGITDKTAVTFETWARGNHLVNDSSAWDQFFEFGDGSTSAILLEIGKAYYFGFYPDRKQSSNAYVKLDNVTGYNEKWTHYVFVRNWDATNSKWENIIYVNGVAKSIILTDAIKSVTERGDYSDSIFNKLTIGGTGTSNNYSFRGNISTFKVYDGVLSAEDVAEKYSAEKSQYIEFPDTFSVTGISRDTATIPINSGEITLEFDNYINVETLEDGIKFTKGVNEPIAGGVTYETHTDDFGYVNSVTLKYGVLETGETYTLSVTNELKSLNKNIPCDVYEKVYEVENFDIFEDFSGSEFVVGEKPSDDSERGITYNDGTVDGKTTITSVMEENGDKFVRLDPNGVVNQGATIRIDFAESLMYSLLCVDLKVRPSADVGQAQTLARELLYTAFTQGGSRYVGSALGNMTNGTVKVASSGSPTYIIFDEGSKNVVFPAEQTDENGFYDIRVLFKRDENDNVKITIKNMNDLEATPITADMVMNWNKGKISFMNLAHCWVGSNGSGKTGNYMDLSEFHIRTIVETDILTTNIDTLAHTESEFSVAFTNDMNEDALAKLELFDKDEEKVETTFLRYDESLRTAYYKLGEYLDYDSDYTLSLAKLYDINREPLAQSAITFRSACHEAEVMSISLKDGSGNNISSLNGVETAKLSIQVYNNGASTKYFNFAMIVYDDEGRIVKMLQKPEDIDAAVESGRGKNFEVDSTGVTLKSGYSIKAIAWFKDVQKGAISFMEPVELG